MINSNVTTAISHTKVSKTPDNLRVLPLVGTRFGQCFWGGVTYPIIIQVFGGDTPIHYVDMTTPVVSSTNFTGANHDVKKMVEVTNVETCEFKVNCKILSLSHEFYQLRMIFLMAR